LVAPEAAEVTRKFKPQDRDSDQREMRAALSVVVAAGGLLAFAAFAGTRPAHHQSRPATREDFPTRLDRAAQAVSGRRDVVVRCGATGAPTILGRVLFYGDRPGREVLLAPQVCATLRDLWRRGGPSLSCTSLGGGQCGEDVVALAWATSALAHESVHLRGVRDEAAAECYGLQSTAFTARALGAPPAYARALADYTFWNVRPPVDYGYFSSECRDGGKLDLRPQTSRWP
jgi:hypothetical protein